MEIFYVTLGFVVALMLVLARPTSRRTRWYDKHLANTANVEVKVRLTSPDGDAVEWRLGEPGPNTYFQSKPMLVATSPNSLESLPTGPRALSSVNSTCADAPPRLLASTSLVKTYSPALR